MLLSRRSPEDPPFNNYRSRRILEAVNYLFAGIMSRKLGEMEYTERSFFVPQPHIRTRMKSPLR